jgi:hypothetical protein
MQQETNESSQEKRDALGASNNKRIRVEKGGRRTKVKKKWLANWNASKMLYFIIMYFGPKMEIWFEKLYGVFCWVRTKKSWHQNVPTLMLSHFDILWSRLALRTNF